MDHMYYSSYFMVNTLALLIYPSMRIFFGLESRAKSVLEDTLMGEKREVQILALVGMSLVFKIMKSATPEEAISTGFMFAKLGTMALFFFVDFRLGVLYSVLCFVLWVILRQPKYNGPSKMIYCKSTDQFFEELLGYDESRLIVGLRAHKYYKDVRKSKKSGKAKKDLTPFSEIKSTLLVFTATWSDTCVNTYSMWVKLANRFSTPKVQVIEVDTSRHESIARFFGVNHKDGNQLPSLVLLEDNKEYLRFPPFDYDKGTLPTTLTFKEKELI